MNAATHRASIARTIAALGMLATLVAGGPVAVAAQEPDADVWTAPVNLSRSGAASAPVVAAGPEGVVQAFWWDRFDGLTTSIFDPQSENWQPPAAARIVLTTVEGEGENAKVVVTPIGAMPALAADTTGRVHAFWPGEADEETGLRPLLLSRLRLGTGGWTDPDEISESVSAWALGATPGGTLHLAYVRPTESATFPAGIYAKRSNDNGATWSAPQILVASRYFRTYTAEQLNLTLHAADDGGVFVGWDEPRLGTAYVVASGDGGATWSEPMAVGAGTTAAGTGLRFLSLGTETVALWQTADAFSGCELHQQPLGAGEVVTATAPARVMADLTTCPTGLRVLGRDEAATLLIAGEGSNTLTLWGWDGADYSLPKTLSFSFEDPETGARVYLSDLHAALSDAGRLVVVGVAAAAAGSGAAEGGEVWALQTAASSFELAFAPPSPWSAPVAIAAESVDSTPGVPATAIDAEGRLHLLWTEGDLLRYSRRETDGRFSQPVTVAQGGAGDPALLALGDRLHAVWAQGPGGLGQVVYSTAYTRDAYAAETWSDPRPLSLPGTSGAAPAMLADAAGALHVVFAVPLNEGRGVTYTRSQDLGSSWTDPVVVFDATAPDQPGAAWPMVDHTALAVDAAGTLHVVFVEGSAEGPFPPQGVWTVRSADGGESWSAPFLIAEGATVHPRVAAVGAQVLVLWQDLDRGTLAMRTSDDYAQTWSYQQFVPGFQAVQGEAALLTGGPGALTLVGWAQDFAGSLTLQVTAWDGTRWSPMDTLAMDEERHSGAAAALDPDDGTLHVLTWTESRTEDEVLTLHHTSRSVATTSSGEAQAPVPAPPTSTPTPGPSPTPTPTPRPTVNAAAPKQGMPALEVGPVTLPLSAVGGIVGVTVVVLGAVLIVGRKR